MYFKKIYNNKVILNQYHNSDDKIQTVSKIYIKIKNTLRKNKLLGKLDEIKYLELVEQFS